MFIVQDYSLAILFCVVTMLCWGSWGNTQKLASKTWRYEFFYWDYVIGVLLFSVFSAFTLGSFGSEGQGFLFNLAQADMRSLGALSWVALFLMQPISYYRQLLQFAACR